MSTAVAHLQTGRDALARGAWAEARDAFERSLAEQETPEALEGLGLAAWWLDLADVVFDVARARLSAVSRTRRRRGAARVAVWLAWDCWAFRGESAVANGWLQRARRLLDGRAGLPERAWLELREGALALFEDGDPDRAHRACGRRHPRRARGRQHRSRDARPRRAGPGARGVGRGRRRHARARRGQRRGRGRRAERPRRDRPVVLLHDRGVRSRARLRPRGAVVHAAQGVLRASGGCGRCSRSAGRSTRRSACGAAPGSRPSRS